MAASHTETLLQHICRLVAPPAPPDPELLQRFIEQRDGTAFAAVVRRHGPMVLGVCRRVLHHEQDAEDAFQATFLVLARKAGSLSCRETVGHWLYRVASQVALKARTAAGRRAAREGRAEAPVACPDAASEMTLREARALLDEELARLPERLRAPLVLCCLKGTTRDEAARQLGWSLGTLKRRLAQARALLRSRLSCRGLTLSSAWLAVLLNPDRTTAAVPAALVDAAVRAALAPAVAAEVLPPPAVFTLTQRRVGIALLLAGLLTAAAGYASRQGQPTPPAPPGAPRPTAVMPRPAPDLHGDPLPEGALARMGTVRWRHGGAVVSVAFAADGKSLASASHDGTFRLWEAATGKELRRFTAYQCSADAVALSRDGKVLAGHGGDAALQLWELASGKQVCRLGGLNERVSCFGLAPDGKTLAVGVNGPAEQHVLRLHAAANARLLVEMKGHKSSIAAVTFTPAGKTVVSAGEDGTVCFWDAATGKELRRLAGSRGRWQALAFAPDGRVLASASHSGKTVHLWDRHGKEVRRLTVPERWIWAVAFAPDGKRLATAGQAVRVWDTATGKEVRRLEKVAARAVAFSPDGRTLAAGCDYGAIRLFDAATGQERFAGRGHASWIWSAALAPDGRMLATACLTEPVRLWDARTGRELRRLGEEKGPALRVTFSLDGRTLAGDSMDGAVRLWDAHTGKLVRRLAGHEHPITAVVFAPDGRTLATGSREDNAILLWEVASGKQVRRLEAPCVETVAYAPDGRTLAAGSFDVVRGKERNIRLWNVASGKEVRRFEGGQVRAVCFSPDGSILAAGGCAAPVRLWDVASGKEVGRLERTFEEIGQTRNVFAVCFSPDGRTLASAEGDGVVWLWEAATGQRRRRLAGHQRSVFHAAFGADGRTLISSGADTTALVWDVLTPPRGQVRPLEAVWADLAGQDAARAYDALCILVAAPGQSVPLLRQRLRPVPVTDAARLARLLAELDSDRFATRRKAMRELEQLEESAAPALRQALGKQLPLETRRRIERILEQLPPKRLLALRALEVLEHAGTPEARELLAQLSRGLPEAPLTREAKASLERLRSRAALTPRPAR
jgi:RNA polymerase sigma factor (sigma-70 family)